MSVVSKPRLGKRPPLGGLVCGPCPSSEGIGVPGDLGAEMTAGMGGPTFRQGYQGFGSVKLFAGQRTIAMAMTQHPQVYLSCCGEQCTGVPEPRNHGDGKASVFLPQRGLHTPPKAQDDIWATPTSQPPATPLLRPVTSSINTSEGYRSPEPVDMDEIMAAMVLTSLSYSPAIQSPPMRGPSAGKGAVTSQFGPSLKPQTNAATVCKVFPGRRAQTTRPPCALQLVHLAEPIKEALKKAFGWPAQHTPRLGVSPVFLGEPHTPRLGISPVFLGEPHTPRLGVSPVILGELHTPRLGISPVFLGELHTLRLGISPVFLGNPKKEDKRQKRHEDTTFSGTGICFTGIPQL